MTAQVRNQDCGLCLADGKKSESTHFCKECDSYICATCKDSHNKFRELRRHNVVSTNKTASQIADITTQLTHLSTKPSEELTETSNATCKPEDMVRYDISSKPSEAPVQATTAPISKDKNNGLLDLEIKSSMKVNIRESGDRFKRDKGRPFVYSCCFMPSGELVLSDFINDKIKVLDKSLVFKESLQMLNTPMNLAALDASSVVVILRDVTQMQIIRVLPSLKKEHAIRADECLIIAGVDVVDGRIYVLCDTGHKKSEIRVYGADRKLYRKINTSRYEFFRIGSIAVNKSKERIFITDYQKVTCLTSYAGVHYQYRNEDYTKRYEPGCLYLDEKDNLLVCDEETNEVQMITASGKKYKTLLTPKDEPIRLQCVAYRPSDGTLAIGSAENNNLFLYKLA